MVKKVIYMAAALGAGVAMMMLAGCGRQATAGPRANAKVADEIREKLLAGAPASETQGGAVESTGSGWSTLRGTFKFVGTPPKPGLLKGVDKDTEVCGKGKGIMDNSLLVASDGGIANIVLYARAKRVHESAAPIKEGAEAVYDQKGCMFLTHVLAFQLGQKLDIKNSDPIGHNTKIDPSKGTAFNQTLAAGQSVAYVATAEEALPATVSCSIHPWMRGYVLPRKDKYFAVTKSDGSFEIANLPAGEDVEIQVWHEHASGPSHALVLDKKDLKWTGKGRFKVRLEADKPLDLALEVPAAAFN
jgi:plastocyanin